MEFIPSKQGCFNIHKPINLIHHMGKFNNKHQMIICVDVKISLEKIQVSFLIKGLNNLGIGGKHLNIKKTLYDKPTTNIVLNG